MNAKQTRQLAIATLTAAVFGLTATASMAKTVKVVSKKRAVVTTTKVTPHTTTIVEQHADGTSDTVQVRPDGFSIVDGMPFYPTQTVITPTYRTITTTDAPAVVTGPSTTVVSTSKVNTTTPVTIQSANGSTVTVDKPATVISTTTTTPVLVPAPVTPVVAVPTVPRVTTVPTVVVTP